MTFEQENLNCICTVSRFSRKTTASQQLTRMITRGSLKVRHQLGQNMRRLSCQRLLREPAGGERRKRDVLVKNAWLHVLKNSKSWMKSLGSQKDRHQGQTMARRRRRAERSHFPQIGNRVKTILKTGNTAQKVKEYASESRLYI